jgi:hypothetical protein
MSKEPLEQRLEIVERRSRQLALICLSQMLVLGVLAVWVTRSESVQAQSSPEVLHARGLILEDSAGRPRILIGSPFPHVKQRLRQDATTSAMVFLDEQGHDRLTVGEETQPQIGGKIGFHRIASGYGVIIHDNRGDERGAYSWLSNGRALITLDRPGAEAWVAVVNDRTGEAGMALSFPPDVAKETSAIRMFTRGQQASLVFSDKEGTDRARFESAADGDLTFKIFNQAGQSIRTIPLN